MSDMTMDSYTECERVLKTEFDGEKVPLHRVGKGCQTSIYPWLLWLSKAITVFKDGFDVIYPIHHSGVVWPSSSSLLLLNLELSDTKVYEPSIRTLLGTASHFCELVVLKLKVRPLSSKFGTSKTVKASFWPWLEPFFQAKVLKAFQVVPFSLGSGPSSPPAPGQEEGRLTPNP
jgi:hypothetical protein